MKNSQIVNFTAPLPAFGHPLPIGWGEGWGEGASIQSEITFVSGY